MTTGAAHWGYSGAEGPEHWGRLSEAYRACSEGAEQSPVDISNWTNAGEPAIRFDYSGSAVTARNNGHTVYLDFAPGDFLAADDTRYELLGVHYHSPAEHEVAGERFAAELHLVHQAADGSLAVVGLLFRLGVPSPLVQCILDAAPNAGESAILDAGPSAAMYGPADLDYYGYDGSLTTPPCSEGVRWIVMQSVDTVSQQQVDALQALTGGPNNRPVQPIGSRTIFAFGA